MRETPVAADLVAAVAAFLRDEAAPGLAGRQAFHARVAANALDIVGRELAAGGAAAQAETARLQALLGEAGDGEALNRILCERIAADAIDADDPALLAHLRATTMNAVAIDQPRYATYRRLLAHGAGAVGDAA